MGCCGFQFKSPRRKSRRKGRESARHVVRTLTASSRGGQQKGGGLKGPLQSGRGLHSESPSLTFSDDDPYFDALSRVSGGSPRGISPPRGGSPLSTYNDTFSGQPHGSMDLDAESLGLPSPFSYLLDRMTFPALRRSLTRSRRAYGGDDDPETAAYVASGEREADNAIILPEGAGIAGSGCLPRLPMQAPLSPKRYVRTSRPFAGTSMRRKSSGPSATATGRVDGIEEYSAADGTTFMIRSKNYMKTKAKEPSVPSIYNLIGCDIYSFDFKLNHIARHVHLPEAPRLGPAAEALPPQESVPPLLIINVQLPTYPASFFGPQDGPGQSLVYYFALPEGWEPCQVNNPAAVGLLQRLAHNGREDDGSPTRDCLKLIPRVVNPEEWAKEAPLSTAEAKLLYNYNDKPLLTRPQHKFFHGPNYLEIDVDVHSYAYLARRAFGAFIPRLTSVVFENAFVIQGNQPEELPEVVLAAARVARVDFQKVRPFPAVLDRTTSSGIRLTPRPSGSRDLSAELSALREDDDSTEQSSLDARVRPHAAVDTSHGHKAPAENGSADLRIDSASDGQATGVVPAAGEAADPLLRSKVGNGASTGGVSTTNASEVPARQADGTPAAVQSLISQYEHSLRVNGQPDEAQPVAGRRRTGSQHETHAPAASSPIKGPER